MRCLGRNVRKRVALVNNPVAPTVAVIAADAVAHPAIFFDFFVATPSVNAWGEKEGRRRVRGGSAVLLP